MLLSRGLFVVAVLVVVVVLATQADARRGRRRRLKRQQNRDHERPERNHRKLARQNRNRHRLATTRNHDHLATTRNHDHHATTRNHDHHATTRNHDHHATTRSLDPRQPNYDHLATTHDHLATTRSRRRLHRNRNDHLSDHQVRRARRRQARRARAHALSLNVNATMVAPIRHHDPSSEGIRVGLGSRRRETHQCPPPAKVFVSDLCSAPACLTHRQCRDRDAHQGRGDGEGRKKELVCCFNGCVHTCTDALDRPPVIDWLEDTGSVLPILDETAPPTLPIRYEETLAFVEGGEEEVRLPGGCTISGPQYSQLQDFMRTSSIQNCMCSKGEVVCSVKMFNA